MAPIYWLQRTHPCPYQCFVFKACEIVFESQNPLQAAHQLISVAWSRWLEWDDRIDDITATVLFIDAEAARNGVNPWTKAIAESARINAALDITVPSGPP